MKLKTGVTIDKLNKEIKSKLELIEKVCKLYNGQKYNPTITSTNDGKHMKGSKHYKNSAIDLRIWDMTRPQATRNGLKYTLGADYDVILEKDHIHIEYDKR